MIDIHRIEDYKEDCVKLLTNPALSKPYFDCIEFSSAISGVYSIYDKGILFHVESSLDMSKDMEAHRNHTNTQFRSTLGRRLFKNHPSLNVVSEGQLFPPNIEIQLDEYLREHVTVSLVPIQLSQSELNDIKDTVIGRSV